MPELSVRPVEVEEKSGEVRTSIRQEKSLESGEKVNSKPSKNLLSRIFEGHEEWLGYTPD
jgi:hypothetical protein